jgi:hypothetical protein
MPLSLRVFIAQGGSMMRRLLPVAGFWIVLSAAVCIRAAEPAVLAKTGEERVDGEAADQVLAALKASFLQRPCVRAEIISATNDPLLGETKETGELLLQMPQRFLRRFGSKEKPKKAWFLDGNTVRESNIAQGTVNELDFTNAPKKLALLKAAITMDAEILKEYFSLTLFKKAGGPENAMQYRLVMTRRENDKNPVDYKRIEACWSEGAPFFSEILRVPKTGEEDRAVERFTKLQVVEKFADGDFKEPLLERNVNSKKIQD